MKFAAIADVHGNIDALEAVLADIASLGVGEVVNLGDHVSGPLEAARTADLLMARGSVDPGRSGPAPGGAERNAPSVPIPKFVGCDTAFLVFLIRSC